MYINYFPIAHLLKNYYVIASYGGDEEFMVKGDFYDYKPFKCIKNNINNEIITSFICDGKFTNYTLKGNFYKIDMEGAQYLIGSLNNTYVVIPLNSYPNLMPVLNGQPISEQEVIALISTDILFLNYIDINVIIKLVNNNPDFYYDICSAVNSCIKNIKNSASVVPNKENNALVENYLKQAHKSFEKLKQNLKSDVTPKM